ncbi:hypothetical protein DPMN_146912 [Dreissena polymorpha]|uniref:Uncharacterized protein n=2 Tax=Dreissena polymorpha TaxID=45954 RepID=A0A9D4F6R3_DREPO|nr:hypothetical protein DPMN_146912 [Dreissena polymorpha]
MWDTDALELLKTAIRQELGQTLMYPQTDANQEKFISKNELALHCMRTTHPSKETTDLIYNLLKRYQDAKDSLGVPLLRSTIIQSVWEKQKHHIACIQDSPSVQLYIQTGTLKKGDTTLPTYRCARGSTSLESFHLHLARFIPGTLANEGLFEAYLVEGLSRWNQNRGDNAVSVAIDEPHYSQQLRHEVNRLSADVLGKNILPSYSTPRKYTGELIGLDYQLSQTGKALQYASFIEKSEETEIPDLPDDTELVT